jgi:hypothetical protein
LQFIAGEDGPDGCGAAFFTQTGWLSVATIAERYAYENSIWRATYAIFDRLYDATARAARRFWERNKYYQSATTSV